jgi:NAD(P)-dependent dehydrogenase (short-subunit alcohol dehydrogenase family)
MPLVRLTTIKPHKAVLTENNIGDQSGKVFIVTGATGGIGKELIKILYDQNAKVYIAARSNSKAKKLIEEVKLASPESKGELAFLKLELDDLTTIKASAEEFLAKENRLDVLWNNAGVMIPPEGSKTKQGYELQLGINNLGHFLFTHFLTPILQKTAKASAPNSVRVLWVSSSAADGAPRPAIDLSNMDYSRKEGLWGPYMRSKAGSVIHSVEFARRTAGSGIISIVSDPLPFLSSVLLFSDPPVYRHSIPGIL